MTEPHNCGHPPGDQFEDPLVRRCSVCGTTWICSSPRHGLWTVLRPVPSLAETLPGPWIPEQYPPYDD